jgi:hypothetical protein
MCSAVLATEKPMKDKHELLDEYEHCFIIVADREKGAFFHLEWNQENHDLFKIMDYLRLHLEKKLEPERANIES